VLAGRIERGTGSALAQLFHVLLRACELERRQGEETLEERIFALEDALERLVESERRWRRA
jgi:hypothetical protein